MPNGQPTGGYNPVTGYQRSVVPYQPTVTTRPDSFPGGTASQGTASWDNPAVASATPAAPAYGPIYQPGQQSLSGGALRAAYPRPQILPGGTASGMPVAPARLCEGAQILGRVGNDVILTCDVLAGIDDMMSRAKGRIPPDKVAEQRAMLVQEVTAAISDFNAHYKDPDPAKAMSPSHRGLLNQLVRQQIDIKLIYQDFRRTVPKENIPSIEENISRHFEETQLKILMKRENVVSLADLESALRAKGSSLDREKRIFMEQVIAQQWVQQKVKPEKSGEGKGEDEVTHEEMLTWYQSHLKNFEQPAKARWEELMISFARHPDRNEAKAAVAALGNRVIAGASWAEVAKSASEGPTARQGGLYDWTHKDSLISDTLNHAIFNQPVGFLSPQILESQSGFHIIRVVERQELTRKSFLDAQKEIKENIQKERFEKRYKDFVEELRKKYPVWTVFDNALQEPKNPDDEDRYSAR